MRPDVVSQAQLLTNAHEEATAQIAAGFPEKFQSVSILIEKSASVKAQYGHGLFFIFLVRNTTFALGAGQQLRNLIVATAFPQAEGGFQIRPHLGRIHIAEHGNHGVVGHSQLSVKSPQIISGQGLH